MLYMFLIGVQIDDDVIQVNNNELTDKVSERIVHDTLERRRSIRKSEGHPNELVLSRLSIKGRLFDGVRSHTYLVVSREEIDLREDLSIPNGVQTILDSRQGVSILNGDVVKESIVNTHPPLTMEFRNEKNGESLRTLRGLDNIPL